MDNNKFKLHRNDIPASLVEAICKEPTYKTKTGSLVMAIDTETTGLKIATRDRLCAVQFCFNDGIAHIVHFDHENDRYAPNLRKLLEDENIMKLFHYARFDLLSIKKHMEVTIYDNIYCTKIASRLARTYTDRHSLKALVQEFTQLRMDKGQGSSDWGCENLSKEQVEYAGYDVLYLHKIMDKLNTILIREKRMQLALDCFAFLPVRVDLDERWDESDIFRHNDDQAY